MSARFRSLAILTDRWAPMQTALDCLSMEIPGFVDTPHPLPPSLPFLESLVLMRCNEFVPYHAEFSPAEGKDATHLPFGALLNANERTQTVEPVLPRLKKLVLSGVHTNWASLPRLLPAQPTPRAPGLETLELSYHCNDVRPTERDFKALLVRCTRLRELVVRVSGPQSPESSTTCSAPYADDALPLPHLDSVELGYDDAYTAATVLDMLHAPALRHLALEEASSPASETRVDAEPLLAACTVPVGTAATSMECAGSPAPGPFPRLESLALTKVDASAEAFAALYGALPGLRALTVSQMFLLGGEALRPDMRLAFEPPVFPPGRPVERRSRRGASTSRAGWRVGGGRAAHGEERGRAPRALPA
uniref:Phospholipid-transporting ATPase (EC) n=1 Tax=Ganoderma boninense TaxID=34458 RepID=A0A5K1JY14_9APHY|nr:Phospholipid-transporting ATPase (EC [Ganoderma boninense]